MERQLVLVDATKTEWKLDERTREVGRRNVAIARELLRNVAPDRAA